MLQHLDRLSSIESLALPEGIDRTIHQNRLLKLAREGRKMSSRDLTRFSAARRHAILVCVLEEARATLTDEVIELHERMLNSLFSKAKRTQAERLQQTGKLIQSKLRQYIDVGQALSDARDSGGDPWLAIENILPWPEFVASLEETRHLARKNNFDPLHIITEKYSTLRKYAPRMLSALQLVTTPAAQPLADALVVIKDMYRKQSRKVPATAPLEFVPESWRKVVLHLQVLTGSTMNFVRSASLRGRCAPGTSGLKVHAATKILMITSFPKRTWTNSHRRCHCPYLLIFMSTLPTA